MVFREKSLTNKASKGILGKSINLMIIHHILIIFIIDKNQIIEKSVGVDSQLKEIKRTS